MKTAPNPHECTLTREADTIKVCPHRPGASQRGAGRKAFFVAGDSIVRKIWGQSDVILFIFAGAAAEFALNKAVDWLYFTGKLPSDPLGRLFSTVSYARKIVFAPLDEAHLAIDTIKQIHDKVEAARGASIPDWAYRDVLFMLVHYSIAAYELFNDRLSDEEKQEVYDVFYRVGLRMGIKDLPADYTSWLPVRQAHLMNDLQKSAYTSHLFKQYKKHLGMVRYFVLLEGQKLIVPGRVKELLQFSNASLIRPLIPLYLLSKSIGIDGMLRNLLLPGAYKEEINQLDRRPG